MTENADATVSLIGSPQDFYYRKAVALVFVVPALGGFLFGYDIGATSYAIVQLMYPPLSGATFTLAGSPALTGLVVSAPSAGALIGTTVVFGIAEAIGRRMELRVGGLLYLLGALLEASSAFIGGRPGVALTVLVAARLIYGTGIGFAMHGAPTYLGEMLPPSIRGALVSGKEVAIVMGILMGYAIGYGFSSTYRGWAYTYASTLIASVMMLVLSYRIPYSARWLVSQGRDDEALVALMFVWVPDKAREELDAMLLARRTTAERNQQQRQQEQRQDDEGDIPVEPQGEIGIGHDSTGAGLFDPSRRAALTAGIGLVALQQVTGQPSVLSYFTVIASAAGLSSYASVLVALFKVLATSVAVVLVEKKGRRPLLITGCSLMLVALTTLTLTFHGAGGAGGSSDGNSTRTSAVATGLDARSIVTLVAMFVYIGGYQVGFGPISWLIISEVFPQAVRGQAVALAVQTNFFLNAVVQFAVPLLESQLGLSVTFGIFAILTAFAIYFVFTKVPETKGLTLEEIEDKFASLTRAGGIVRNAAMPHNGSDDERVQLVSREGELT